MGDERAERIEKQDEERMKEPERQSMANNDISDCDCEELRAILLLL
jgi:hypothetical protein